ncbi:MAG: transketolase, partial [Muribaculaceae bacterium]|nr:transketolase [Muribaculaceae bacterium]
LRPADGEETLMAWKTAVEEHRPVALILSRQDIKDLPAPEGTTRIEAAYGAERGGYTVVAPEGTPDVVLVANGSEVSLLCEVAALLQADGIRAAVVSMPSAGLFNIQPEEYRMSVLPAGIPQFGLTAGLPVSLRMIDGFHGQVYGMERFGASAPYKVLDEKFGFTPEAVYSKVRAMLQR